MNIYHKVLNTNRMVGRKKDLRSKSTNPELILWQKIRNGKLGYKFKRQYSVVNYVVDFYCAKLKLAIEIDGGIHSKSKVYDDYRTRYLRSLGILEIRFSNDLVTANMVLVLDEIRKLLPSPKIRRGTEGEV